MPQPQQHQQSQAPGRVNHDVRHQGRAVGHKDLVQFVTGGVGKNHGQGEAGFGPVPRAAIIFHRLANRAPDQPGQHGIFRQMTGLAKKMVQLRDGALRHLRKQPPQQRLEQGRRVMIRFGIGGKGKNQQHPNQHGQPITQKIGQRPGFIGLNGRRLHGATL